MVMYGIKGNALRTSGQKISRTNHKPSRWAFPVNQAPDLSDLFSVTSLQKRSFTSSSDIFPMQSCDEEKVNRLGCVYRLEIFVSFFREFFISPT